MIDWGFSNPFKAPHAVAGLLGMLLSFGLTVFYPGWTIFIALPIGVALVFVGMGALAVTRSERANRISMWIAAVGLLLAFGPLLALAL